MAAESRVVLYSATATGNGTWIYAGQFNVPLSILLEGTFGTDSFQIMVKNDDTIPADATDGVNYGAAVTVVGFKAVTETYKWIKVKKTAGTAAITVTLFAQLVHG